MDWILSVVAGLLLLLLAWISRKIFKSWLAPSSFFALYWAFAWLLPLFLVPRFYFWSGAVWLVFFYALIFFIGNIIGWGIDNYRNAKTQANLKTKPMTIRSYRLVWGKQALLFLTLTGFMAIPVLLISRGYSLTSLLTFSSIAHIARDFSVGRYLEGYITPAPVRVSNALSYLAAYVGGVWWAITPSRRKKMWALLPVIPMGIQALIMTSRNHLLVPVILLLGGYFATVVLMRAERQVINAKLIRTGFVFLLIGLLVFIGLQTLRDDVSRTSVEVSIAKLHVYAFGSPAAFSQWLKDGWDFSKPGYGTYTLAGIFDKLGLVPRQLGLYTEFSIISDDKLTGLLPTTTNVYTVFRGYIQDITLPGSFVFMLFSGIAMGVVYHKIRLGNRIMMPVLVLFYAFTLWSYLASILYNNTHIIAWVLFFLYISIYLKPITQTQLINNKVEYARQKPSKKRLYSVSGKTTTL